MISYRSNKGRNQGGGNGDGKKGDRETSLRESRLGNATCRRTQRRKLKMRVLGRCSPRQGTRVPRKSGFGKENLVSVSAQVSIYGICKQSQRHVQKAVGSGAGWSLPHRVGRQSPTKENRGGRW